MLFHYGWMAVIIFWAWALSDFYLNGTGQWPSIFYMNWLQWKYLLVISVLNSIAIFFGTVAFQNGKSAFVSLIALVNVVYSSLIDVLIFDQGFTGIQVIGAVMITGFNIASIMNQLNEEEEKQKEPVE
jgi:drug/metabolite transporter (DMT)-like permease